MQDGGYGCVQICQSVWSPHSVEACVEEFCLPFLRVAALLRQHKFGPPLPDEQVLLGPSIFCTCEIYFLTELGFFSFFS